MVFDLALAAPHKRFVYKGNFIIQKSRERLFQQAANLIRQLLFILCHASIRFGVKRPLLFLRHLPLKWCQLISF